MKLLIGIFFLVMLLIQDISTAETAINIQEKLSLIPPQEKMLLDRFFRSLVETDGWGYALFGTKALSLAGYFEIEPIDNILCGYGAFFIKQGWAVWEKYAHLFPHPHYIMAGESHKENLYSFYLINKANALIVINQHLLLFQKELPDFYDANRLLKQIEESHSLYKSLNQHEGLLGVMLGFGQESSMNYHQRDLVIEQRKPLCFPRVVLDGVSYQTKNKAPYLRSWPIVFVGNSASLEVKSILNQNKKDRKKVVRQYSQGNFLEITLQKLTEF
ncbi:MAG: hypothetical protein KBC64_08070 [Simkaniaceae bacterium]|nr:hypothetical protein [Simkaniaceae bacterium]